MNNSNNKYKRVGINYIFSKWIFIIYLFYIFNIIKIFNPFFLLIFGSIISIFLIIKVILRTKKLFNIGFIIFGMTIIKYIPLYTLRNTFITTYDIIISFILFFIYLVYVKINNVEVIEIYENVIDYYVNIKDINEIINNIDLTFFQIK